MIDPKKQAELDQNCTAIGEVFPPMLWRLYQGLVKEGFPENLAYDLTKAYFTSVVRVHKPQSESR